MNCWHCNTELTWGGDHDLEPSDSEDYDIVTNLSCPKCESFVEVYHKREKPDIDWNKNALSYGLE
jgi:formate dehydrogenase maturation protein FdhE